jgi:hypothetical protein
MKRSILRWGILLGGWLGLATSGFGQAAGAVQPLAPPTDSRVAVEPGVLAAMTRAMTDDLRRLEQVIRDTQGKTEAGKVLVRDIGEQAQAVDEFRNSMRNANNLFAIRQLYSGIDQSWHHLLGQLMAPGVKAPAIEQAAERVTRDDARIHQALNLNPLPANYYTDATAPTGINDVKRLARALDDRAAALADTIRADMNEPGGSLRVQMAVNLATATDAFHDAIDLNATPVVARNGFAAVDAMTNDLRQMLQGNSVTPRVRAAWQSYLATVVLLKQVLGLNNPPEALAGTALVANRPSPVVALAGQFLEQINSFVNDFALNVGIIPDADVILADAQRLQTAAADFRQDVARGLTPSQLAFEYRDVDALWQRFARRFNRIAPGQIQAYSGQFARMGQTIADIHRLLGLPGYPSSVRVGAPASPPR